MTKHSKLLSLAACIGTLFAVAPASALVTTYTRWLCRARQGFLGLPES